MATLLAWGSACPAYRRRVGNRLTPMESRTWTCAGPTTEYPVTIDNLSAAIDPTAQPAPSLKDLEESLRPPSSDERRQIRIARAFAELVSARAATDLDLDDTECYPSPDVAGMIVIQAEVLNALLATRHMHIVSPWAFTR